MTKSNEKDLDLLIDALNEERKPEQKSNSEVAELFAVARAVKSLKQPAEPSAEFSQRITEKLKRNSGKRRTLLPVAALVASLLLLTVLTNWAGLFKNDPVYAMEKAVASLTNYYGILEIHTQNAAGEEWLVRQVELWSEGEKYAIRQQDDVLTVNNGERKWQVRPESKEVALLPLAPDPMQGGFDLRDEAKLAKKYPYTVIGSETIGERKAVKLEISPPGGLPYYLWIDSETDLPIQLQTAMQNGLQSTYTFVHFEPNTDIDAQIFAYQPPHGYKVVEKDPGQLVASVEEAAKVTQFNPLLPEETPKRIIAFEERIVLDYGDTTIVETPAQGAFEPLYNSALGSTAEGPLEVWGERLRWQQNGIEIQVEGRRRVELARQIAADLTLPDTDESLAGQAQVKVEVDLAIAKASQQQIDGGHTPWQLDPLQVSLTFVNLQITPQGIQGEPTVPEQAFTLEANNGVEAVVKVAAGPIKKVYLKRLIRADETGIWSVVGYDPR